MHCIPSIETIALPTSNPGTVATNPETRVIIGYLLPRAAHRPTHTPIQHNTLFCHTLRLRQNKGENSRGLGPVSTDSTVPSIEFPHCSPIGPSGLVITAAITPAPSSSHRDNLEAIITLG